MAIRLTKNPINIHAIYSPRTSYKKIKENDEKMIADMTLNFDKLTINLLKEQFAKKDNKLQVPEFIMIAKKHLKFWQVDLANRQNRLIRYLTYLFNQIDINGNGDMEWDQFTNYIIEKATVLKNLKSKNDEIKHYIKSQIVPKIRIDGIIAKVEYLSDLEKIAYYQEGSNIIYFINAENGELAQKNLVVNPKKLVVNISSVKKEKNGKVSIRKKDLVLPTNVRVLDMLYLCEKKYKILLVSSSDGYVRGWKYTQNGIVLATQPDNEEEAFQHHFSSQIYCLAWDNINEVLYCGQKNGGIYMWNLKTDLQKALTETKTNQNQNEGSEEKVNLLITTMITMPKLQFMASGRMDGKLILWDTINSKKKCVYKQHTRGILSLAFNQTMILLFSAGFDHKICIWNPYIPSLIHKIEGHLSPILTLKVVEGTHQLISMDSEGIVKITDTRRFNIISSFSVQTENTHNSAVNSGGNVTSFMTINKPQKQVLRLVFAGKSISFYEYDKNYNPFTADENTVISCRYVKETLCFFTPAGNKIKVWSALNGDVEKIYMDITSYEISSFDFDFLKKRMIIGDTKGNVALYNTANGAKMKNLTKHTGEVTHLIAAQNTDTKTDIFISCGLDNQIRISKQTEQSFQVIRTIYLKKDIQITCLKYCMDIKLIMVGTNVGNMSFFDIQTGKNVGTCLNQNNEEFTSICQTSKEIIISSSSNGCISLIGIPPFPNRFQKLISFFHKDCQKLSQNLGVRLSCFNKKQNLLYIIDDKMYLSCYSLAQTFEQLDRSELVKEKIEFQRRNMIKDIFNRTAINLKWQIKAHSETVKVLEYIYEQNILTTASFDKKVKIWNATTGQYIDSLQQNYNKTLPQALAYYDTKKNYLYTRDRKKAFENTTLRPLELDFDPFVILEVRKQQEQFFPEDSSNKDWSLQINFKDVVNQQKVQFNNIVAQLQAEPIDLFDPVQTLKENVLEKKLLILERKRKLMKQIKNQSTVDVQSTVRVKQQRQEKKFSTNYFRRSMIKCIQSFVDKNESIQLMQHLKNDKEKVFGKKKHFDYIPIYKMVNQGEKTNQQINEHKKYVLDLAKKETENIINSRKNCQILLSQEETQAANKLYRILKTTEGRTNNSTIKFISKENNQRSNGKEVEGICSREPSGRYQKSVFHELHTKQKNLPRLE